MVLSDSLGIIPGVSGTCGETKFLIRSENFFPFLMRYILILFCPVCIDLLDQGRSCRETLVRHMAMCVM